jgi:hypothetical protein
MLEVVYETTQKIIDSSYMIYGWQFDSGVDICFEFLAAGHFYICCILICDHTWSLW